VHRLLLDNNLSPRLLQKIEDLFPGSVHVMHVGLDRSSDWEVWNYARAKHLTILTKDSDFNDLTLLRGAPPKVIWIRTGNCRVATIEHLLRTHAKTIFSFLDDHHNRILELHG